MSVTNLQLSPDLCFHTPLYEIGDIVETSTGEDVCDVQSLSLCNSITCLGLSASTLCHHHALILVVESDHPVIVIKE